MELAVLLGGYLCSLSVCYGSRMLGPWPLFLRSHVFPTGLMVFFDDASICLKDLYRFDGLQGHLLLKFGVDLESVTITETISIKQLLPFTLWPSKCGAIQPFAQNEYEKLTKQPPRQTNKQRNKPSSKPTKP